MLCLLHLVPLCMGERQMRLALTSAVLALAGVVVICAGLSGSGAVRSELQEAAFTPWQESPWDDRAGQGVDSQGQDWFDQPGNFVGNGFMGAKRGPRVAQGSMLKQQQLFSIMERSPPGHGSGANDDPFLNLSPPLNPAISSEGHYGQTDPFSDRDPPIYTKSGLAMLRDMGPTLQQLAKGNHLDPLPRFIPTYKVGSDPLPGFIPTFKAARPGPVRLQLNGVWAR